MTIDSAVFQTLGQYAGLSALVGARIYPDAAPQTVAKPYVVYQEIAGVPTMDLSGDAVSGGLDNTLMQVSAWATTQDQARAVGRQVRAAMAAATAFRVGRVEQRSLPREPETRLFCVEHDFSVWLKT